MNRAAGLAIGAAILSVTLGVMIGFVIHAGQVERADDSPPPFGGTTEPALTTTSSGLPPLSLSSPLSPSLSSALPGQTSDSEAGPEQAGTVSSGLPPVDSAPATSSSPPMTTPGTPPTSPVTSVTSTSSTTSSVDGVSAADEPCPSLAVRGEDAAGTTLYCQVDQSDRTLRWRAVVNGGGCLNQTMTGVGADGVDYACRLDESGRNHWAPAS